MSVYEQLQEVEKEQKRTIGTLNKLVDKLCTEIEKMNETLLILVKQNELRDRPISIISTDPNNSKISFKEKQMKVKADFIPDISIDNME